MHLERDSNVLVTKLIEHGSHMGVQVLLPAVGAARPTEESESRAYRLAVAVRGSCVTPRMHQRLEQIRLDLRPSIAGGPDGIEDPSSILKFSKVGESANPNASSRLRRDQIALRFSHVFTVAIAR